MHLLQKDTIRIKHRRLSLVSLVWSNCNHARRKVFEVGCQRCSRDATGVYGVRRGYIPSPKGVSPPQPTRESVEAYELPSKVRDPRRK